MNRKPLKQIERDSAKDQTLKKDFVKNNSLFNEEQASDIYDAFECFQNPKTKTVNLGEFVSSLKLFGFDSKNVIFMKIFKEMEKDFNNRQVDFETFFKEIIARLGNTSTPEGRNVIFNLITQEKSKQAITVEDLKMLVENTGQKVAEDQLEDIVINVGKNKKEITREDFEKYYTKRSSVVNRGRGVSFSSPKKN